jgi:hypothetical protein
MPPSLESVAIRLAIARAMTNRDGEDVCGCRMATIDCVVSELLLVEANGLPLDYYKHSRAENKKLPGARSTRVSSTTVNWPANDMGDPTHFCVLGYPTHSVTFSWFVNLPSFSKLYRLMVNLCRRIVCVT